MADEPKIVGKRFIHSCHVKSKHGADVVVKEKILFEDGSIKPNIAIYHNPMRSFYITKPKFRTYKFKPEYELVSRLDQYRTPDHELISNLAKALGYNGYGYIKPDVLFKSPYVFGADISIEALIKMRYLNMYPNTSVAPTVGFLDIETSIDTGEIILISYMHDDVVHTAVLESFLFMDGENSRIKVLLDELVRHVQEHLQNKAQELINDPKQKSRGEVIANLRYNITVLDTEVKLIAWIMRQIHLSEIDFIQIWNMAFDVPMILSSLKRHNADAALFFNSPKVPRDMRYLNYYPDNKRQVAHFTLRWPWLYSTCGTQMVDAMGLYSQCRRTAGFRDKYTLDAILDEDIGLGKLPLTSGSHVIMQRHHFRDYVVYNIFDVIGLRFLEDKNRDILSMSVLSGPTPLHKFATQTIRATNAMYHAIIGKGMVLSSYSKEDNFTKLDKLFPNQGGAVLPPGRVRGVGICLNV